ncbi:hypothetical protein ACNFIC_13955 [Pseudomonas sp. NY15463]|uniref:hypothetical protein n=1 Tax=Pseudomonas sp. NY15463 TaxID=3400361 RepID=UPI003A850AF8
MNRITLTRPRSATLFINVWEVAVAHSNDLNKRSLDARVAFRFDRAKLLGASNESKQLDDLIVADELFADKSDGTVKSAYLFPGGPGFSIQVPEWFFSAKDILRIEHSRDNLEFAVIHEEEIKYYDDFPDFPYSVKLDTSLDALSPEGVHYFRSYVLADNFEESHSPSLLLRLDRVPPYARTLPAKFNPVPLVTDASLTANGGKVILELPAYADWQEGDVVFWYWLKEVPADIKDIEAVGTVASTGQVQQLEVPEAVVRKIGDGGLFAVYILVDKAGNISPISDYVAIDVALDTLPTVFADPVVPLATPADNHLIDQGDALEGVEVWVPLFANWKSTDTVKVTWKTAEFSAEPVGSAPGKHLRFKVDSATLLQEYDGTTLPEEITVRYDAYRGTHKLGGAETTVFVNFDSIDPTWPGTDWPDPVHPDLKPAHVNGRGSSSGDDELDRGDTGQDADITIVLSAFIQEQDILTLDWGSQVGATTHTVTADDITDGKATFPVPWPAIEAEGNKTVEVSYWVSRTDVHNPIKSQATPVAVSAVVITSEAVDFLEKNAQGQLNCTSIRNSLPHADNGAVQLAVPDLRDYEKYGPITEVDITWWAVKGGSDSQGEDEVPGVRQTFKVTIGPDYPLAGFTWRVPYEKHVAPTFDPNDAKFYRARARVTYSFKAGSESIGSKRGDIVLAMYTPSGACDLS